MKKILILASLLLALAMPLSAQITHEQADAIVLAYLQNEVTTPYILYVNVNAPNAENIVITTSHEETFQAKYACWVYYLNENPGIKEPARHRYLFVKEDDGNLLEVIINNDLGVEDLTQWAAVEPTGIASTMLNNRIQIYPNPTTGQFTINNEQLIMNNVEVYDMVGKKLSTENCQLKTNQIDISHLPAGVYFVRILSENRIITEKVIKN